MSVKRGDLFVGLLENKIWNREKLLAYFTKYASVNDDQYITDCRIMSYREARFQEYSFAFLTFNDPTCVDRCMKNRRRFLDEYGITIKLLLPDSISKCERLMSSAEIVIRLFSPDPLFTEDNLRSYFGAYGSIVNLKMLEEESCAGICFLTFADPDSSDRVLLDLPHSLNGQPLSIYKYDTPDFICSLSQFRFIEPREAERIHRWYSISRNFTSLMEPLRVMHKTQLALMRHDFKGQIIAGEKNLSKAQEDFEESEEKYQRLEKDFLAASHTAEQLRSQIDQVTHRTDQTKRNYEEQIEECRRKNQALIDAMR